MGFETLMDGSDNINFSWKVGYQLLSTAHAVPLTCPLLKGEAFFVA